MDVDLGDLVIIVLIAGGMYFLLSSGRLQSAVIAPAPVAPVAPRSTVPTAAGTTSAAQSISSGTLDIGNAGGMVIIIPNEGHHGPDDSQTQFPGNAVFVPEKAIVPTGCSIVFLSDDEGHSHVIDVVGMGATKSLNVNGASAPMTFSRPGTFAYSSNKYASVGQRGTITVSAKSAVANKVAGAIWVPQADVARFKQAMSTAGCTVTSEANASRKSSGQSVTSHTLLVYTAVGTAAAVASKLAVVTKMTPYT